MRNCILLFSLFILFAFSVNSNADNGARAGKDQALFFAVCNYKNWKSLTNPISEAEAIAKELRDHYGFSTEVLKDPGKAEIQAKIEEYRKKTYAPDAQLLIFFTGHGEFIESTREGFFIPQDAGNNDVSQDSYLSYLRLQRWIETLPCQHILLAIDACYSGTFSNDIALKGRPSNDLDESDWREQFIRNSLQYRSRIFMASGAKVRTPDHSAFAAQFLAALRSFGGDNRLLNATELWTYIQRATPKPCMASFGGGDSGHEPGGDFIFVLERTPEPAEPADPELAAWSSAQRQNTLDAYVYYLEAYPAGRFRAQAAEERAWLLALRQNTPSAFQIYLDTYPNGIHRIEALPNAKPTVDDTDNKITQPELTATWKDKNVAFLEENKKRKEVTTTSSGLQYEVLRRGSGRVFPKATDKVEVHYTGTLIDGQVFDSSVERNTTATFGLNQVIKGWTEGLQHMKEGDKFKFFIPADLAYGDRAIGTTIKGYSTLIFDVELIKIVQETGAATDNPSQENKVKDAAYYKAIGQAFLAENKKRSGVTTTPSGLQYEVLKKGAGTKSPAATDKVEVHYTGTLIDGTVFDSSVQRGATITFGLNQVIKGWTEGLQLMHEGDKFKFYISADLAYGDRSPGAGIPPGSTLIFEVELFKINP